MPGPFIFIATNRPRDGKFDAEQQQMPELAGLIEAHEPRCRDACAVEALIAERNRPVMADRAPTKADMLGCSTASKVAATAPEMGILCSRKRPDRGPLPRPPAPARPRRHPRVHARRLAPRLAGRPPGRLGPRDIDGICKAARVYPLVGAKKDELDTALGYFEYSAPPHACMRADRPDVRNTPGPPARSLRGGPHLSDASGCLLPSVRPFSRYRPLRPRARRRAAACKWPGSGVKGDHAAGFSRLAGTSGLSRAMKWPAFGT